MDIDAKKIEAAKAAVIERYGPGILKDVALGLELLAGYVREAPTILDKLNPLDMVLLAVSHQVSFTSRGQLIHTDGKRAWFRWPQGILQTEPQVNMPIDLVSSLNELAWHMTAEEQADLKRGLINKFAREAEQRNTF